MSSLLTKAFTAADGNRIVRTAFARVVVTRPNDVILIQRHENPLFFSQPTKNLGSNDIAYTLIHYKYVNTVILMS